MPTGVIPRSLHSKGYGFIKPDDGGADVFFHVKDLAAGEESDLEPGTRLSYEVKQGRRGPQAADVRVVRGQEDIREADVPYSSWREAMEAVVRRHMTACVDELVSTFGWE